MSVWLLPTLGDRALDAIRGEDVEDLIARMEAGDRPDRREGTRSKPCGPKTIRNYMGTLSAIYRFASHPRRRWATTNPVDDVDLPDVEGRRGHPVPRAGGARRARMRGGGGASTTRSTGRSTSRQR